MVNVLLFAADGGRVRGLTQVGAGTVGAVPRVGDYIAMGTAADDPAFEVESVAFLINEDAARLIVSPLNI